MDNNDLWCVTATVRTRDTDHNGYVWDGAKAIPTFYLHGNVQGIICHRAAAKVALSIVDPLHAGESVEVYVTHVGPGTTESFTFQKEDA